MLAIKEDSTNMVNSIPIKRFPLSLLSALALSILLILRSKVNIENSENIVDLLIIMIPLFMVINLSMEKVRKRLGFTFVVIVNAVVLFIIWIYYSFFLGELTVSDYCRHYIILIAITLAIVYIPFLYKKRGVEKFSIILIGNAVKSLFYSTIIALIFVSIIYVSRNIFDIKLYGDIYNDVLYFMYGTVAVWGFILTYPTIYEDSELKFNKTLEFILVYIVFPIMYFSAGVLFFYSIIVGRNFVKNDFMILFFVYTAFSAFLLYIIMPLCEKDDRARIFDFVFSKFIIVIAFINVIFIYMRISDFGITEPRYYFLITSVLMFCFHLYWAFINNKRNNMVLVTISLVFLLTMFGPWDAESMSVTNQNSILSDLAKKNNMIFGKAIKKAPSTISEEDYFRMKSILEFFNDRNKLDELDYELKWYDENNDLLDFYEKNNSTDVNEIILTSDIYSRNVEGFDLALELMKVKGKKFENLLLENKKDGKFELYYDTKNNKVIFKKDNIVLFEKDIVNFTIDIYKKNYNKYEKGKVKSEILTVIQEKENYKIMLVIESIKMKKVSKKFEIESLNATLFYGNL